MKKRLLSLLGITVCIFVIFGLSTISINDAIASDIQDRLINTLGKNA